MLVADEPTGDLDSQSAEEILTLMETFNRDFRHKTIVMVTHDPRAGAAGVRAASSGQGGATN